MDFQHSVFSDRCRSIDVAKEVAEGALGVAFEARPTDLGNLYELDLDVARITIYDEHLLEDDCGIPFTKYVVVINAHSCDSDASLSHAKRIADAMVKKLGGTTIVVRNLQSVVYVATAHPDEAGPIATGANR